VQYESVVWRGDNVGEVELFLGKWVVRADQEGQQLHLIGLGGLEKLLEPGDQILRDLKFNQVGFLLKKTIDALPSVTWKGDNMLDVARFVKDFPVRIGVEGTNLFVQFDIGRMDLVRGDRLVKHGNTLAISQAGIDHRAA
jgi:hypothetical protein